VNCPLYKGDFSGPSDMLRRCTTISTFFNIYRGRKMFNLNFSARNDKQAIADATDLVPIIISPNFDGYFGIVHRTVASGERASRISPNRLSLRQTRTTCHQLVTLTKWSAELVVATLETQLLSKLAVLIFKFGS